MTEQKRYKQPFKRIMFCTDFSGNADYAFDFALEEASRSPDSVLYLFHVIPEPDAQFWKTYLYEVEDIDAKARSDIDAKIKADYLSRLPEGMDLEVDIRVGSDYAAILEFAEEKNVDLIIIGRHGRSSFSTIFFGSVTEKIVRKAKCAVLIIPKTAKHGQEGPTPCVSATMGSSPGSAC
ncbi:MAG: universal stress protein [Spartobacteria bacterium]|nr:universal stress protein [Spartobacteria bacterium]